jgi:hypothetical protein
MEMRRKRWCGQAIHGGYRSRPDDGGGVVVSDGSLFALDEQLMMLWLRAEDKTFALQEDEEIGKTGSAALLKRPEAAV